MNAGVLNDDFRHRNSQYWRYLLLPPRQKGKLRTKTCIRCKSIPTTCKICTWCKILREVGFFVYRGSFSFPLRSLHSCAGCSVPPHLGRTSNHSVSWCYRLWGQRCPLHPLLWAYAVHDRLHKYNPLRLVV